MVLAKEVRELENMIQHAEKLKSNVSTKSVDWHIDHSLRFIEHVAGQVAKSDPAQYIAEDNAARIALFRAGNIPRGVAEAPASLMADVPLTQEAIMRKLETARALLETVEQLPAQSHFKDPYFGMMNVPTTIEFMTIHTEHHLKIIRDIVAAA